MKGSCETEAVSIVGNGSTILHFFRTVPKRGTALEFTGDDRFLLVADKSGEVTRFAAEVFHLLSPIFLCVQHYLPTH